MQSITDKKEIILLHHEEYTIPELAKMLDLTINKVKYILYNGRAKKQEPKPKPDIKKVLEKYKPGPEPVYFNNKYYGL